MNRAGTLSTYETSPRIPAWKYFGYGICGLLFLTGVGGLIYTLLRKTTTQGCSSGQISDPKSGLCYYPGTKGKETLSLPSDIKMSSEIINNPNVKGGAWCSPTFYRFYIVDNKSGNRTPWYPLEGKFYGPVSLSQGKGCYDKNNKILNAVRLTISGIPSDHLQKGQSVNVFMYKSDDSGNPDENSGVFVGNLFGGKQVVPNDMPNPSSSGSCCYSSQT